VHCSTIENSIIATVTTGNGITTAVAETNRIGATVDFRWLAAKIVNSARKQ